MSEMEIRNRLSYILYKGSAWRYTKVIVNADEVFIELDAHGMDTDSAKRVIDNTAKIIRMPFMLGVIHGCNHGTAIRDAIYSETINSRIKRKSFRENNPGYSFFEIA